MPETRATKAARLAATQAGAGCHLSGDGPSAAQTRPAPLGALSVLGQDAQSSLMSALRSSGVLKVFRAVSKDARDFVDHNLRTLRFTLRIADYTPAAAAAPSSCGVSGTSSSSNSGRGLAAGREARAARRGLLLGGWRRLLERCPFVTTVRVTIHVQIRPPRPELFRSRSGRRADGGLVAAAAAAAAAATAAAATAVTSTLAAALMPQEPRVVGSGSGAAAAVTPAGMRVTSLTLKLTPTGPDGLNVTHGARAAGPPLPRTVVPLTPVFAATIACSFPHLSSLSFVGLWRLPPAPPASGLALPAGDAADAAAAATQPQPRDPQREVYAALARLRRLRRLHMGTYDGLQHIRLLAEPLPAAETVAAADPLAAPAATEPMAAPPLEELELGDQFDVDSRGADVALLLAEAEALATLPHLWRLRLYEQARTCISLGVLLGGRLPPRLRVLELGAPADHWPLLGECWCRLDKVVAGEEEEEEEYEEELVRGTARQEQQAWERRRGRRAAARAWSEGGGGGGEVGPVWDMQVRAGRSQGIK